MRTSVIVWFIFLLSGRMRASREMDRLPVSHPRWGAPGRSWALGMMLACSQVLMNFPCKRGNTEQEVKSPGAQPEFCL